MNRSKSFNVLESIQRVVDLSKHVSINKRTIEQFCSEFNYEKAKQLIDSSPIDLEGIPEKQRDRKSVV